MGKLSCTSNMSFASSLLLLLLLVSGSAARPAFRPQWDLPGLRPHSSTENHNFEHRDSLGRVTKLSYVAKMREHARSLDDVNELESVVCEGDTMVFRFNTDMQHAWNDVSVVSGGAEWGCTPKQVNASLAPHVAPRNFMKRLSKTVWSDDGKQLTAVSAPATHMDVFSRLKIDFSTNNMSQSIVPEVQEANDVSTPIRRRTLLRPRRSLLGWWDDEWDKLKGDVDNLADDVESVASDITSASKVLTTGSIDGQTSHGMGSLSKSENFNLGPVSATASVDFSQTTFHFSIDMDDWNLNSCEAYVSGSASWNIDASASSSYSYSHSGSTQIGSVSSDFTFYAGIPWNVKVSVPVTAGYSFQFNAAASIEATVGQTYNIHAGYSYDGYQWSPVQSFSLAGTQNNYVSTFSASATGIVFVNPSVVINVDDTLAPYIGVVGSLQLSGKNQDGCDGIQAALGASVKVQAGMKFEGLAKSVGLSQYNVGPDTLWGPQNWNNLWNKCVV